MSMPGARFTVALVVAASACLLLLPGLAHAQAIGGTVSDSTGAVLPGVTVEARSPALIEQVRTAVTDGNGQYLIVALETGVYSVTFTLPGFSTVVRDAVELSGGFTANIDVELPVGALEETVIVTQASPEIDVQSVEQRETIDRDIYEALPTARSYDSMALLVPALNIQGGPTTSLSADTGGLTGGGNNRMSIHGSRDADSVVELDGMDINQVAFEGAPAGSPFDAPIEEFVYDYSGSS
ncbi:MAG: carboxypeptidase regulatory-like domain-containing protein, partial [Acidobacteria bacterium]|nr:carboxypeptidase regulatory-like domain-containing protein [Acidobacteriota bacterium]